MRAGDRVRVKNTLRFEGELGTYVRRDMKRFMPFLVQLDNGVEHWLAACFLEVLPRKAKR